MVLGAQPDMTVLRGTAHRRTAPAHQDGGRKFSHRSRPGRRFQPRRFRRGERSDDETGRRSVHRPVQS
jgi:hypothetical protein